jgi:hypothetical protein
MPKKQAKHLAISLILDPIVETIIAGPPIRLRPAASIENIRSLDVVS